MALTDNLVSYWKLDETSGTRNDSHGTNHLTDNNTVLYGTGKQGNCADFERTNSEYLSIADASQTGLEMTTAFSTSLWMNMESSAPVDNNMGLMSKTGRVSGGWMLGYRNYPSGNDNIYLEVWNGGSVTYAYTGDLNLSTATWYHIVTTFSSGTFKLYINGVDTTWTKVGSDTTATDGNAVFNLGKLSTDGASCFDGLLDEVGIWSRALSSTEVADLYNSGSGLAYPFSTTSIKTINGLSLASVKTVNGLAIASVKTVNGLA